MPVDEAEDVDLLYLNVAEVRYNLGRPGPELLEFSASLQVQCGRGGHDMLDDSHQISFVKLAAENQ